MLENFTNDILYQMDFICMIGILEAIYHLFISFHSFDFWIAQKII